MARDTSGPKNEPQYNGSGVPADAADMTEIAAYAAFVGNMKAGPTTGTATGPGGANTGRTTSSGADVWEGLEWWDTSLKQKFRYTNGGWVPVYSGTNLITPSSVGGGTISGGRAVFTGASSVSVNGVFSSAFDNYVIKIKTTANTGGDLVMKLRAGGADNSASYISLRKWSNAGGAESQNQQYGVTTGWPLTANTNGFTLVTLELAAAALNEPTQGLLKFESTGAAMAHGTAGVFHNVNYQADGFTISLSAAGNITGSILVYGESVS